MSARRRGLGRGLDALLGAPQASEKGAGTPAEGAESAGPQGPARLAVGLLQPNRFQPRTEFEDSGLEELAQSIREQGVVQPIVVVPSSDGRYSIVAGERRWRAAKRAGLAEVPVVVREISGDQEMLELALVENVQRTDLNAVEEAEAYRALGETFQLSQEAIARKVGKARTTVTNALRLLRLPREVQDLLRDGRLTAGQARPLLSAPDAARQIELAQRAVREGLSARDLEKAAAPRPAKRKKAPDPVEIHAAVASEKLTRHLHTRVDIKRRGKGGVVQIHFHSEDELIRLYDLLTS